MRDTLQLTGRVEWEKFDRHGTLLSRGRGRNLLLTRFGVGMAALLVSPTTVALPRYIGVGDTTGSVVFSDIGLENLVQYDSMNDAKEVTTIAPFSTSAVRFIAQFTGSEANIRIRQLGLFDAANDGDIWAKINLDLTKQDGERLTIYWYVDISTGGAATPSSQYTILIGAPTSVSAAEVLWDDIAIAVPSAIMQSDDLAYIRHLRVTPTQVTLRLASAADGTPTDAGPDLLATFLTDGTLSIVAGTRSIDLFMEHYMDGDEPYVWPLNTLGESTAPTQATAFVNSYPTNLAASLVLQGGGLP